MQTCGRNTETTTDRENRYAENRYARAVTRQRGFFHVKNRYSKNRYGPAMRLLTLPGGHTRTGGYISARKERARDMAAKTPQEMIEEAAAAPRSVTGNAGSMTNHSLTETIAAARELDRRARAKTGNPFAALGRAQIVPGGAV